MKWASEFAFAFGFVMFSVVAMLLFFLGKQDASGQRDLNLLKSAVYDLDNPTPANEGIRTFECDGWADKAAEWREKKLPEDLIGRYASGCRTQPARPHR